MYDTLMYVKKLEAIGVPRALAEAQVEIMSNLVDKNFATKNDVERLAITTRADIERFTVTTRSGYDRFTLATRADYERFTIATHAADYERFTIATHADYERFTTETKAMLTTMTAEISRDLTYRMGGMFVVMTGVLVSVLSFVLNSLIRH